MKYPTISNAPILRSNITFAHCYWNDAFNDLEITKLENYCNDLEKNDGKIFDDTKESVAIANRKSKVAFVNKIEHPELNWAFERFNAIITSLNNEFYNYDLNGYSSFQYTEYDAKYEGKYNYHIDMRIGGEGNILIGRETRKLSLVLFLSDPDSYEGGQFSMKLSEDDEFFIEQKKGKIILFPSFLLHKVHPTTKGTRKSIVIWVEGPKFI